MMDIFSDASAIVAHHGVGIADSAGRFVGPYLELLTVLAGARAFEEVLGGFVPPPDFG